MTAITPAQRRDLRARAHHLNPVVSIAGNGLTEPVLAEVERSLQAHELIKIKVHGAEREVREELLAQVCQTLDAAPVQHIGTILVIWRKRREDDTAKAAPEQSASERPSGGKRPSVAKSASSFAAAARRTAMMQAAADRRRPPSRGPGSAPRKVTPRGK